MEREIERLYELIRLEEEKLKIKAKLDEALNRKGKMEEKKRKRDQWLMRAIQSLLALYLSIAGAVSLFKNPFVQLFMLIIFLLLLNFLLGKVFMIFKWLQVEKVFTLLKKFFKRDMNTPSSRYSQKLKEVKGEIQTFENDLQEHAEKIKQKAFFLPSVFHNLESFQSLHDYLYFGQAERLESALLLHEQRFRHEENIKTLQDLRYEQLHANQQIREMKAKIEELEKEVDYLKKKEKA